MADRSVRNRLLSAFLGVSAFAVLAAIAALYAFSEVGDSLERITERRVPSALASQELARQASRIASTTAALLSASTPATAPLRSRPFRKMSDAKLSTRLAQPARQ